MQYLTMEETVRRLRAAGLAAGRVEVQGWVREQKLRDVWVLGGRTYIYEDELNGLIAAAQSR